MDIRLFFQQQNKALFIEKLNYCIVQVENFTMFATHFVGVLLSYYLQNLNFFLDLRYFNYRTTQYLASEGFYEFHNWFDDRAWYPLGRIIGGTIYPGKIF